VTMIIFCNEGIEYDYTEPFRKKFISIVRFIAHRARYNIRELHSLLHEKKKGEFL